MKQIKQYGLVVILIILCGTGSALSQKAAVGVGAYDAMAMSFSYLSTIPVGTVGIIFNCACVLGQLVLLKKNFKIKHLLQIPLSIFLGVVINFVLYNILDSIVITNYWVNLAIFVGSLIMLAAVVGAIMELNVITFALEGFCMAIADKWNFKFSIVRQIVDVVSVIICVLLTIIFKVPLTVREGTIIGAILFGPLMGIFMTRIRPLLVKNKLTVITNEDV